MKVEKEEKYAVWFFAGGETRDNKFNVFTGSYIHLMKEILGNSFEYISGIFFRLPMMNVIWALNNAQRPITRPENFRIVIDASRQIIGSVSSSETQLILTSSSSGSIIAAQTACYLAEKNMHKSYFSKPFHLVLGASMIATKSELFNRLLYYQKEGIIGTIIHEEVQDEGDSSSGIGGITRSEAYGNAFGLMLPFLSRKFKGPSFLNTDPVSGHIHRRRSQTVQKALDYIEVILIRHKLAGGQFMEKAVEVIRKENKK